MALRPFDILKPEEIEAQRLAEANAAMNKIPLIKRPSGVERLQGMASDKLGEMDSGIGQFFGEGGPIDKVKNSQIGGLLGGFIDRAGGLMGDPAFRGFAGMMDDSSYVDKQGFGGGGFIGEIGKGLSSAGGLYDAARESQAKRMKAHADLLTARGTGGLKPYRKGEDDLPFGLSAKEIPGKGGKRKYIVSVPPLEYQQYGDVGKYTSPYKDGVMQRLGGRQFDSIEDANKGIWDIANKHYDGSLTESKDFKMGPKPTQQMKLLENISMAEQGIGYITDMLGQPGQTGIIDNSFVGWAGQGANLYGGLVRDAGNLFGQSWGMEGKLGNTAKLHAGVAKLKSMLWRSLVGRGQLSAADYQFIEQNIGVFSFGKNPELVKWSLGKVRQRLKDVKLVNTYLLHVAQKSPEEMALIWKRGDVGVAEDKALLRKAALYMGVSPEYIKGLDKKVSGGHSTIPSSEDDFLKRKLTKDQFEEYMKRMHKLVNQRSKSSGAGTSAQNIFKNLILKP